MSNMGYRVTLENVVAVIKANQLVYPAISEVESCEAIAAAILEHMGLDFRLISYFSLIEDGAVRGGSAEQQTQLANEEILRQLRERGILEPSVMREYPDHQAWQEYVGSPECNRNVQAYKDLMAALTARPIRVSKHSAQNGLTWFEVYNSASMITQRFPYAYVNALGMAHQYNAALEAAKALAAREKSSVIDNTRTLIISSPPARFDDALTDPAYRAQIQGLHDMTAALEGRTTPAKPVVFSIDVIVTDHWLNGEDSFIRVYDPSSPSTHVFPYEDSAQRVDQIRNALEVASAQAAKHGALVSDQTENPVQPLHESQPTENNDSPQG